VALSPTPARSKKQERNPLASVKIYGGGAVAFAGE
jgi:hypothetical protein